LLTAASVSDGRTVVRPLPTKRSASDAGDDQTVLYAPPTARFAELGISVSLPIFIQLWKHTTDVAELRIWAVRELQLT